MYHKLSNSKVLEKYTGIFQVFYIDNDLQEKYFCHRGASEKKSELAIFIFMIPICIVQNALTKKPSKTHDIINTAMLSYNLTF